VILIPCTSSKQRWWGWRGGGGSGQLKATFTEYGSGDINCSPNCATAENACGWPQPGYTAALSQSRFGVGQNQGAGPTCGTCYQLIITTDLNGNSVPQRAVTVKINNLCPINDNPICNVPNQYGGHILFNLCKSSGTASALFTNSQAGIGTTREVGC